MHTTLLHRIILSILLTGAILGFALFVWVSFPPRISNQEVFLAEGTVPREIATVLEEADVIRSGFILRVILKLRGTAGYLVPGEYRFEKRQTIFKVASRITRGDFGMEQKKVTIPEGSTNEQIADLIAERFPGFDKKAFLEAAKDKQGYLFPETYRFLSPSPQRVISEMSDTFDYQVRVLQADAINEEKDWDEIVTMASILEEEADTPKDFKIISGILWKRMELNMPFQVDVATSTYIELGFPPRPLSNPGLETLEAALRPATSTYLYYLTGRDGLMHYANTFEDHQRNINRYLR